MTETFCIATSRLVLPWYFFLCQSLSLSDPEHIPQQARHHKSRVTSLLSTGYGVCLQVGDLGIARVLDGSCDLAKTVVGTPYYMSPELFSDQPYNHKSDVWALGCCVYEMATLKHPFSAHNINALMVKIVRGQVSQSLPGRVRVSCLCAGSSAASAV